MASSPSQQQVAVTVGTQVQASSLAARIGIGTCEGVEAERVENDR